MPIMSVGKPVWGEINAFHVFSRVTCLAPPQSPGSGLWNTLSIKPSAHTFCLRSISQRMAMSCNSPTCQICTKSLRGVKYGRSHLSDCASTVQDEAHSTDEDATGQLVCSGVSSARCSCFVSQSCCYNLNVKNAHLPSCVDWLQINSRVSCLMWFFFFFFLVCNFTLETI